MKNENEQRWYDRDQNKKRSRSYRYMKNYSGAVFPNASGQTHSRRPMGRLRIGFILFSLGLVLFGAVKLITYLADSHQSKQTEADLQTIFEQDTPLPSIVPTVYPEEEPTPSATQAAMPTATPAPQIKLYYQDLRGTMLPQMEKLHNENHDIVAWINIPKVVSAPVVYRNNTYYLDHDFYGRKNNGGTIFLDEGHPLTEPAQNLLLYGHNMRDGTMFGHLAKYRDRSYWKEHCIIQFSTLYAQENYVVFAAMVVSTDPASPDYVNFAGHSTFHSVSEFDAYMADVQKHSVYPWRIDVTASDALLTLSTCLDENRVILLSRRFRQDETEDSLLRIIRAW